MVFERIFVAFVPFWLFVHVYASVRYADPNSVSVSPCSLLQPCDIDSTITSSSPGDSIILLEGIYSDIGAIQIPHSVDISSQVGKVVKIKGSSSLDLSNIPSGSLVTFTSIDIESITSISPFLSLVASTEEEISIIRLEDLYVTKVPNFLSIGANVDLTIENSSFMFNEDSNDGVLLFKGNRTSSSLNIIDCVFSNNTSLDDAGSLHLRNAKEIMISNTQFRNNRANDNAGALFAVSVQKMEIIDSIFKNNVARSSGGGACIFSSVDVLLINGTEFIGNEAGDDGGACLLRGVGSQSYFTNSNFDENKAILDDGGAIWVGKGHTIAISTSSLVGNEAGNSGGAIHVQDSYLSNMFQQVRCENNSAGSYGGAVSVVKGNLAMEDSIFMRNVAKNMDGGGFYGSLVYSLRLQNCSFLENEARKGVGGGLAAQSIGTGSTVGGPVWEGGEVGNCQAREGGGVYLRDFPSVFLRDIRVHENLVGGGVSIIRVSYSHIDNGMFENNRGSNLGGGLRVLNGTNLTLSGTSILNNTADLCGGGVYTSRIDDVLVNSSLISNNKVVLLSSQENCFGGGVHIGTATTFVSVHTSITRNLGRGGISLIDVNTSRLSATIIDSNNSTYLGGGIYVRSTSILDLSNVTISNNYVSGSGSGGGGYITSVSSSVSVSNSQISDNFCVNSGGGNGGGLFIDSVFGSVTFTSTQFLNNVATVSGGGIYHDHSQFATTSLHDCIFDSNRCDQENLGTFGGGIFQTSSNRPFVIQNTLFTQNQARSGSSFYSKGVDVVLRSVTFFDEHSSGDILVQSIDPSKVEVLDCMILRSTGGISVYAVSEVLVDNIQVMYSSSIRGSLRFGKIFYMPNNLEFEKGVELTNSIFRHNTGGLGIVYSYEQNIMLIEKTEFTNNTCSFGGGYYSEGSLERKEVQGDEQLIEHPGNVIRWCIFANNTALFDGGSVYAKGLRNLMQIENTVFVGGLAGRDGGDVFVLSSVSSTFADSSFVRSEAVQGGAIFTRYSSITVSHCRFEGSIGSAVFLDSSSFDLQFSSFSKCTQGSGLRIQNVESEIIGSSSSSTSSQRSSSYINGLEFIRCQTEENGGGISMYNIQDSLILMENVTFTKNTAWVFGGGFYIHSSIPFTMRNLHFVRNQAKFGGAFVFEKCDWKYHENALQDFVYLDNLALVGGGAVFDVSGTSNIPLFDGFHFLNEISNLSSVLDLPYSSSSSENKRKNLAAYFGDLYSSKPKRFVWRFWQSKTHRYFPNGSVLEFENHVMRQNSDEFEEERRTSIRVFPGQMFEIGVSIEDSYGQIMNQFPEFYAQIKMLPVHSNTRLLGFSFRVTFDMIQVFSTDNEEEEEEIEEEADDTLRQQSSSSSSSPTRDYLVFSDLSILKSFADSENIESFDSQKKKMKYYRNNKINSSSSTDPVIFSSYFRIQIFSDQVDEDLTVDVELLPCPEGYRRVISTEDYVECVRCAEGKYSIIPDAPECNECPPYSECQDPTFVKTEEHYWAFYDYDTGVVEVEFCDKGNCLGSNECSNNFDATKPLCAACPPDESEWGNRCIHCGASGMNVFLILLYFSFLLLMGITTHLNSQEASSGIEKLYAFFGQTFRFTMQGVDIEYVNPILDLVFGFKIPNVDNVGFLSTLSDELFKCPFRRNSYGNLASQVLEPIFWAGVVIVGFLMLVHYKTLKCCCVRGCSCVIYDILCFGKIKKYFTTRKQIRRKQRHDDLRKEVAFDLLSLQNLSNLLQNNGIVKEDSDDDDCKKSDSSSSSSYISSNDDDDTSSDDEEEKEKKSVVDQYLPRMSQKQEKMMLSIRTHQQKGVDEIIKKLRDGDSLENINKEEEDNNKLPQKTDDEVFEELIAPDRRPWHVKLLGGLVVCCSYQYVFIYQWSKLNVWDNFVHLNRYLLTFLNFLIITYQLYSESAINYFNCIQLGDTYYLRSNTDIVCYSREYFLYAPIFLLIGIYSILFPCVLLIFLFLNRYIFKSFKKQKFQDYFGTLFYTYHEGVDWWYEPFCLFRRLVLVMLMTYIGFLGKALGNLLIGILLLLSLLVHIKMLPYKLASENNLETMSLLTLLLLQLIKTSAMFVKNRTIPNILMTSTVLPTLAILSYYRLRCILPLERLENFVKKACFCSETDRLLQKNVKKEEKEIENIRSSFLPKRKVEPNLSSSLKKNQTQFDYEQARHEKRIKRKNNQKKKNKKIDKWKKKRRFFDIITSDEEGVVTANDDDDSDTDNDEIYWNFVIGEPITDLYQMMKTREMILYNRRIEKE